MLDYSSISSWLTILGTVLTGLVGAYATIRKILNNKEKINKRRDLAIIQAAKDGDTSVKLALQARIHELEVKVANIEESVTKEIAHVKESHSIELKALADKIEVLRDELREQSGSILGLLTKMIDKQ